MACHADMKRQQTAPPGRGQKERVEQEEGDRRGRRIYGGKKDIRNEGEKDTLLLGLPPAGVHPVAWQSHNADAFVHMADVSLMTLCIPRMPKCIAGRQSMKCRAYWSVSRIAAKAMRPRPATMEERRIRS